MGGLGGGHYVAVAKNPDDGLWYERNDSSVSRVHESAVSGSAAYVLFFTKSGWRRSSLSGGRL
jgi:ubiquitin C-terminal hydrolase